VYKNEGKNILRKSSHEIGNTNETKACKYLIKMGYVILARNYRIKSGEIDIICKKNQTIVAVEVKTLKSCWDEEDILYLISPMKRYKIKNVFANYLATNNLITYYNTRFDVIVVLGDKIRHYSGAF